MAQRSNLSATPGALDETVKQIEKRFGSGTIVRLGDGGGLGVDVVSTGAVTLDLALGIGGLPRGRVIEVYGPESSGKTTLALHVVAEAQRTGGVAAYIDVEHALDPTYAKAIGVDVAALFVSQPDAGEDALEVADMLVRSGEIDVLVVDSVAALTPRAELEGEMGASHVGLQARLMSQALRKITAQLDRSRTTLIFVNQLREKVGVVYGSPEVTPGGRALKFYASVRLDVRRIGAIKSGADGIGNRTRVKVVKNKCAAPYRQAEFDVIFGRGIDRNGSILDAGIDAGIVKRAGAWFSWDGVQLGQGRDAAKAWLDAHPDEAIRIEGMLRAQAVACDLPDTSSDPDQGNLAIPPVAASHIPDMNEPTS